MKKYFERDGICWVRMTRTELNLILYWAAAFEKFNRGVLVLECRDDMKKLFGDEN